MESALDAVETALRDSVVSDDDFLTEVAGHLIAAGGKRVRPSLTVAAAAMGGVECNDDIVMGGVSVELVHLGSLYHDDVMDEATTRRSVESVNARWGNLVAILAGDFLLARASEIASSLGTEVAGLLANTISRLCEGQVTELRHVYDVGRTEPSYQRAIAGKTAALMATSCRIGALVADLPRDQVEALTTYGDAFGMVFQVVDDVLDVVATDEELGKPSGNDLAEGIYTLPVIRALASDDGAELRELLGKPLAPDEVDKARKIVRANGAIPAALVEADRWAAAAADALLNLPASDVRDSLAELPRAAIAKVRT